MAAHGKGYVPDYIPKEPKIAFILDIPSKDAALDQDPFSFKPNGHKAEQSVFWEEKYITNLGHSREDVLVTHAIRCVQPPNKYGQVEYPSGFLVKPAEINCRHYDTELLAFNPNVFVLTLHPRTAFAVGCNERLISRDVEKAFSFAAKGYRPAVLFGEGPSELYYPWIKGNGGLRSWRGTWWCGESPFKDNESDLKSLKRKLFKEG